MFNKIAMSQFKCKKITVSCQLTDFLMYDNKNVIIQNVPNFWAKYQAEQLVNHFSDIPNQYDQSRTEYIELSYTG